MDTFLVISMISSLAAIGYAIFLTFKIMKEPEGDEKMQEIAGAIREGAFSYLKRQNSTVFVVALVLSAALGYFLGRGAAFGFLLGSFASGLAGFLGMVVAVNSNSRCTQAAKKGLGAALALAFRSGAVTGLLVGGLALFVISLVIALARSGSAGFNTTLVALGFGGSLVSVFARLGGGIYTKGADVGTDMVGKIEKGIPEDDPRNPGVIADLVGDNVGDDAGMAADLFETYVVTTVSAILLGGFLFGQSNASVSLPLVIGAISLVACVAGTFFVKLGGSRQVMPALYKGLGATAILGILGFGAVLYSFNLSVGEITKPVLFINFVIGFLVTLGMVVVTEFYTGKGSGSVKKIAQASLGGHGTNVIIGLATSMKATLIPILIISAATLVSFWTGGLYGIAIAAVSMLSLTAIIVAIDAFGPITDNAGGIAEMSGQKKSVRKITDALDAVGNTTKAVTKAYAVASAGLAALVLFSAYNQEVGNSLVFSLADPVVLAGLLMGAAIPYFFAGLAMEAVGNTASAVVAEIRRQFKEIKGIMGGAAKPQYGKAVDIVTRAALKEMILPALIPVAVPTVVGLTLGSKALGGLLIGVIVSGLFLAISMTTGGAAWDNAKKYIEDGHLGGKGGLAHAAAVTGDTVGDPYKDTAGPAINPLIKVVNVVALLLAPFLK